MESQFVTEFKRNWLIYIFGVLISLAGSFIIIWNEGRAVKIAKSLEDALNACVTLNDKGPIPLWEFEGDLVHLSGPLQINEPLTEPDYNIEVSAVKLKRRVQMYQWIEEKIEHAQGEDTVMSRVDTDYYYNKEWRDRIVDSDSFYFRSTHVNPKDFPVKTHVYVSEHVKIGALQLGDVAKNRFNKFVEVTSDERPERPDIKLHSGMYYHCFNIFYPEIGDIRIQFSYAGLSGDVYTIIGQQVNNEIKPFKTSNGLEVLLLFPGDLSIQQAFTKEHSEKLLETWGFRAAGWFLLFCSTTCLMNLINLFLERYRNLYVIITERSPVSASLTLSLSGALLITALAWVCHRPVMGASLAAASVSPFFYYAVALYNAYQGNNYHRM